MVAVPNNTQTIHVLYIGGEQTTRDRLARASPGAPIELVVTAEQTLPLAPDHGYDVVVCDLHLPRGLTFPRLIAAAAMLAPPLPVVVATASGTEQTAVDALKAGVSDYIALRGLSQAQFEARLGDVVQHPPHPFHAITLQRVAWWHVLERAVHAAAEGFTVADANQPDLPLVYVNPAFEHLTGYRAAEIVGRNCRFLQGSDSDPTVVAAIRTALRQQQSCRRRLINYRKDGTPFVNELSLTPVFDAAQNLTHYIGIQQDITAQVAREQELHRASEHYHLLSSSFPAVLIFDTQLCHTATTGAGNQPHLAPDTIVGKDLYHAFPPALASELEPHYAAVLRGENHTWTMQMDALWYEIDARPVYANNGIIEGGMLIWRDITQQYTYHQQVIEKEARHRALLNSIPDLVFRLDEQGRFVDYSVPSSRTQDLMLPAEAFMHKHYSIVLPSHVVHQMDNAIATARAGNTATFIYELTLPNGSDCIFEAHLSINPRDGHIYMVTRNVTEAKLAEERIQQNAARANALARVSARLNSELDTNTLVDAISEETAASLGMPYVIITLYHATRGTFHYTGGVGLTPEEVQMFQPYTAYLPGVYDMRANRLTIIHNTAAETRLANHPLYRRKNIASLIVCTIVRQAQLIGTIVVMIDSPREFSTSDQELLISIAEQVAQAIENTRLLETVRRERAQLARRVAERTADLSNANAQLERASRMKDEFLASMSHELRTPLNTVLGYSEMLEAQEYGTLNEEQLKATSRISESGRHLLSLITDVLDVAKIEAGTMHLIIEPLDVATVCAASLRLITQAAMKKNVTVHEDISTDLPPIQADSRRVKQILVNLLSNAVKFTPEGGNIGLTARNNPAQEAIDFLVWDDGIGIDPIEQQRIFQPFMQVSGSLDRQYGGTGLGLTLVMRMVELHSGSINVDSSLSQGSRFTISLPWQAINPTSDYATTSLDPEDPATTDILPTLAQQGHDHLWQQAYNNTPVILLAEDNEANVALLRDFLEHCGYEVIVARNGHEVIAQVNVMPPALILMDIHMPDMDGLETIRRLRTRANLTNLPIIATTALAMPGDRTRCLQAGATAYISKPMKLASLHTMIQQLLTSNTTGHKSV